MSASLFLGNTWRDLPEEMYLGGRWVVIGDLPPSVPDNPDGNNPDPVADYDYSPDENTELLLRWNGGSSTTSGTFATSDITRARNNAADFLADIAGNGGDGNYTKYFWPGPKLPGGMKSDGRIFKLGEYSGNITDLEPVHPHRAGVEIEQAALAWKFDASLGSQAKQRMAEKIAIYLEKYADAWIFDFRNSKLWPGGYYNDLNPMLFIAPFMEHLKNAWMIVRHLFPLARRQKIDTWLFCFFWYLGEYNNDPYPNSWYKYGSTTGFDARVLCDQNDIYDFTRSPTTLTNYYTHTGGYRLTELVNMFNNRRMDLFDKSYSAALDFQNAEWDIIPEECYRYSPANNDGSGTRTITVPAIGTTANLTAKIDRLVLSGELFFKESIRFGYYPDGTCPDLYRASGSLRQQGINYAGVQNGALIHAGDKQARTGKTTIYNFETSMGIAASTSNGYTVSTLGGPKSVFTIARQFKRMYTHEVVYYVNGFTSSNGSEYIQDGVDSTRHYELLGVIAPLIIYRRAKGLPYQELKDGVLRNRTVYPSLTAMTESPSAVGPFPGRYGHFGKYVMGLGARWYKMDEVAIDQY